MKKKTFYIYMDKCNKSKSLNVILKMKIGEFLKQFIIKLNFGEVYSYFCVYKYYFLFPY